MTTGSAEDTPRPRPRPRQAEDDAPDAALTDEPVTPPVDAATAVEITPVTALPDDEPASPEERPARTRPASTRATTRSSTRASTRATPPRRLPARRSLRGLPRLPGRAERALAIPEPPPAAEVVAVAGSAIVTAARVGRLLGRTGWRMARQVPAVAAAEAQATRVAQTAVAEMARLLDATQRGSGERYGASAEEQRVMMLVRDAGGDPEPLRTAMTELLERSSSSDVRRGREYLFGTIVSQLVPDEARILAALAGGRLFAVVDVVAKQVGRSQTRTVLSNASTVGAAAGVALPENVPTYLTRLQGFGLLDLGQPVDALDSQFAALGDDPQVRAARAETDNARLGSAKLVRKSVTLSALGREFWTACAPARTALDRTS